MCNTSPQRAVPDPINLCAGITREKIKKEERNAPDFSRAHANTRINMDTRTRQRGRRVMTHSISGPNPPGQRPNGKLVNLKCLHHVAQHSRHATPCYLFSERKTHTRTHVRTHVQHMNQMRHAYPCTPRVPVSGNKKEATVAPATEMPCSRDDHGEFTA